MNEDNIINGTGVSTDPNCHGLHYLSCCSNETSLSIDLQYQQNYNNGNGSSSDDKDNYDVVLLQFAYSYETLMESDELILNGTRSDDSNDRDNIEGCLLYTSDAADE